MGLYDAPTYREVTFWPKVTFAPEKTMLKIVGGQCPVTALTSVQSLSCANQVPTLLALHSAKLRGLFRAAEFKSLRTQIDQMRFLQKKSYMFTLQILSTVCNTPQTSVHDALKRQQRLGKDIDL
jgi:hypothetical protein